MNIECPYDITNQPIRKGTIDMDEVENIQITHVKKSKRSKTNRSKSRKKYPEDQALGDYFTKFCRDNTKRFFVNMFVRKLKQGIVKSDPVSHPLLEEKKKIKIFDIQSQELNKNLEILLNFVFILQIITLYITVSLSICFSEIENTQEMKVIEGVCLLVELIGIVIKFTTVSKFKVTTEDEKIYWLSDVARNYLKSQFFLDFYTMIILLIDIFVDDESTKYLKLLIFFKFRSIFEKLKIIEIYLIQNCYKEQYWEMAKVFFFNFLFAHAIAVLLILMAKSAPGQNSWLTLKNLSFKNDVWTEIYIWAYYWGTTIMLTVGFGDISATTSHEALYMVFIETLSCILLTYNINTVGNILRNIKTFDDEEDKKVKIFIRMQQNMEISRESRNRVMSHIHESTNILKNYNIDEEENLINSLPQSITDDLRKQINLPIFLQLPFFRNISQRYLEQIALKLERKLSHPNEVILKYKKIPDIMIANNGSVTLNMNAEKSGNSNQIMQTLKISKNEYKILSLNFLVNKPLQYDMKSADFTSIYRLSKSTMEDIIRSSPYNYQYYCMLRDKEKVNPNEFEVIKCQLCSNKELHTVFECPKLHYIPLREIIIEKNNRVLDKEDVRIHVRKCIPTIKKEFRKNCHRKKYRTLVSFTLDREYSEQIIGGRFEKMEKKSKFAKRVHSAEDDENKSLESRITNNIKEEISKISSMLKERNAFEWPVESDVCADFEYYFPRYNPKKMILKSYWKRKSCRHVST